MPERLLLKTQKMLMVVSRGGNIHMMAGNIEPDSYAARERRWHEYSITGKRVVST
jgi:hypothetical protein